MPSLNDEKREKVKSFLESRGADESLVDSWLTCLEEAEQDSARWNWARDCLNSCQKHAAPIANVPTYEAWRLHRESIVPNRLRNCNIPSGLETLTLADMVERPDARGLAAALRYCREFAQNTSNNLDAGGGPLLYGDVGVGKTALAVLLCRAVVEAGHACYFTRARSMLDELKDFDNASDYRRHLEGVRLLVLDDLGSEYLSDWSRSEIDAVVTARYEQRLPIVSTSNFTPKQLVEMYGPRVVDRLKERGPALEIRGKSWRKKR